MLFRQLFDPESSTYTYLLADTATKRALLIDPVRDQVERDIQLIDELGLTLAYTLETHVHADHIAGSGTLRKRLGSRSFMSERAGAECADVMLKDGQQIELDGIQLEARLTPGHTNGCVSYVDHAGGRVFTGDTLLIRGCGRTDFQQGSSDELYSSVHDKLFTLPEHYLVYPGHDYRGRTVSSIAEEKQHNPRLGGGRTREEFVDIMANLKLSQPKKISIAVPANLECGLPHASEPPAERGWAPIERVDGVPEVTPEWVVGHADEVRVIDVRELDELEGALGRFPGAEHVPLAQLESALPQWNQEDPHVVLCKSGGRSGRAAAAMEKAGFKRVASMRGGMLAWRDAATTESVTCG